MPKFVCKKTDVPRYGMKECSVEGYGKILVLHCEDGNYFACEALCPHRDYPLCEGYYNGKRIRCPAHGWEWDVRTQALIEHTEEPLTFYNVSVEGDSIYLDEAGASPVPL